MVVAVVVVLSVANDLPNCCKVAIPVQRTEEIAIKRTKVGSRLIRVLNLQTLQTLHKH